MRDKMKSKISEDIAKQIYEERVNIYLFCYILLNLFVNVVKNAVMFLRLGKHCPNASSNTGCFITHCL